MTYKERLRLVAEGPRMLVDVRANCLHNADSVVRMKLPRMGCVALCSLYFLASSHSLFAMRQRSDSPLIPQVELNMFFGGSYGVDSYRWMAGGNASVALTSHLIAYGELSYFPGFLRKRQSS